jgi:hypothetical protein
MLRNRIEPFPVPTRVVFCLGGIRFHPLQRIFRNVRTRSIKVRKLQKCSQHPDYDYIVQYAITLVGLQAYSRTLDRTQGRKTNFAKSLQHFEKQRMTMKVAPPHHVLLLASRIRGCVPGIDPGPHGRGTGPYSEHGTFSPP